MIETTISQQVSFGDNINFRGIPSLSKSYPQPGDSSYAALKSKGIEEFREEQYGDAFKTFRDIRILARQQRDTNKSNSNSPEFKAAIEALQDPEVLIFKNNAEVRRRHQQNESIYTIAAAIPLTDSDGNPFNVGKGMLWGIALAQEKAVNLYNPKINIEVVIANDRNDPEGAQAVAAALDQGVSGRSILAVVGHYTSRNTCNALVQAYNQAPIVVVSPLSTVVDLRETCGPSDLFFRTVSSTEVEVKTLINKLTEHLKDEEINSSNAKVAIFYRKGDFYGDDIYSEFKSQLEKSNIRNNQVKVFNLSSQDFNAGKIVGEIDQEINAIILLADGENPFGEAIEVINANNGEKIILGSIPLYNADVVGSVDRPENLIQKLFLAADWHQDCAPEEIRDEIDEYWIGGVNRVTALSYGNFSITAGKPADVELGRGLSREQRSGLTKE
jgi:ABC-type branched-subunit amino acid transport system substrate-binding protein